MKVYSAISRRSLVLLYSRNSLYSCTLTFDLGDVQYCLQVNYAAADAIVALHIIQSLVEMKLSRQGKRESLAGLSEEADMSSFSLRPSLSSSQQQPLEEWLSKKENLACLLSMCQGVVEMPYKQRRRSSQVQASMASATPILRARFAACTQ